MLYTETDLEDSMEKVETINFHEVKEVAGIKFWCYHAGHVLGAAMFMIEIAGVKVRFLFGCVFLNPSPAFCLCFGAHLCLCTCVVVVHRRLLPSGRQALDGGRDSECETRYSYHSEFCLNLLSLIIRFSLSLKPRLHWAVLSRTQWYIPVNSGKRFHSVKPGFDWAVCLHTPCVLYTSSVLLAYPVSHRREGWQ